MNLKKINNDISEVEMISFENTAQHIRCVFDYHLQKTKTFQEKTFLNFKIAYYFTKIFCGTFKLSKFATALSESLRWL
jgi:hypothetical protein